MFGGYNNRRWPGVLTGVFASAVAFTVTNWFRHAMPNTALTFDLVRQVLLQPWCGAWIDVDDRQMIQIQAVLFDRRDIVSAVHRVIKIDGPIIRVRERPLAL